MLHVFRGGCINRRHYSENHDYASGCVCGTAERGLIIAIEHRGYEIDYQKSLADPFASSTTCGFFANFPEYFKLDKWLPSVFQPTGVCGDASWDFAGLTMVQWIIIIFVCNAVVAGIVTLLSLVPFDKYKSWVITARHG